MNMAVSVLPDMYGVKCKKDCIRLFEKGIRTESVDDSNASAFIVFSPDSTQLELFFSNNQPNEIFGETWPAFRRLCMERGR